MPNPFSDLYAPPTPSRPYTDLFTPSPAPPRSPFESLFTAPPIAGQLSTPAAAPAPPMPPPMTPAALIPPPAAPPQRPAFGLQTPQLPQEPHKNIFQMALPMLAALVIGGKDARAVGTGLAAYMHGLDLKRAERESQLERLERQKREQAEFMSRAISQAQTFDDPVAFEQWKEAIAPVAQVYGIDPQAFAFNNQKQLTREKTEAAQLLATLDKQHPDGNYTAQWKGRQVTRAELAAFAGQGAYDAQGQPLAPGLPKNAFTPTTPEELAIAAYARGKGKKVEDLTYEELVAARQGAKTETAQGDRRGFTPKEINVDGKYYGSANYDPDTGKYYDPQTGAVITGKVTEYQRPSASERAGGDNSALVQAVLENPELYDRLTAAQIAKIAPALNAAGFKGFGKSLSESAIAQIAQTKSAITSLQDLRETLKENEQYIGPIAGLQALYPYSDARKAQAKIDLVKQRVGKALEGGVLRKEDEEKYKKILATLRDEPTTAIYKVDSIIQTLERDLETFIDTQRSAGRRAPAPDPPRNGGDANSAIAELERRRRARQGAK